MCENMHAYLFLCAHLCVCIFCVYVCGVVEVRFVVSDRVSQLISLTVKGAQECFGISLPCTTIKSFNRGSDASAHCVASTLGTKLSPEPFLFYISVQSSSVFLF